MATSTGSPTPRGNQLDQFVIHEEGNDKHESPLPQRQASSVGPYIIIHSTHNANNQFQTPKHTLAVSEGPAPLSTSKLGNIQAKPNADITGKISMSSSDKKVRHAPWSFLSELILTGDCRRSKLAIHPVTVKKRCNQDRWKHFL